MWYKERNFSKMRIVSMLGTIKSLKSSHIMTKTEIAWLNEAEYALKNIINNWEKSNVSSKRSYGESYGTKS